jgi:hypothetical protein
MDRPAGSHQPVTLQDGAYYERWEWNSGEASWDVSLVRLIAYDSCPAMVLAQDPHGRLCKIPRSELRLLPEEVS